MKIHGEEVFTGTITLLLLAASVFVPMSIWLRTVCAVVGVVCLVATIALHQVNTWADEGPIEPPEKR